MNELIPVIAASPLRQRLIDDIAAAHAPYRDRRGQRWLGKSGQSVKWSFCLRAARIAVEQSDDEKRTRRNHNPAFKAKVALAGVKGGAAQGSGDV